MATFTITTTQRIDELTSKAGGDTYNINGGTLIIDQDSRYGLNQSTTTGPLGAITISATLGGTCMIDARAVRIIPYNSGSGNVPTLGTSITQNGVSGKLIGVWSAINFAPTAAGSAMPASGFIKVKEVSGAYASGALTGIGATATGADVAGWIEVVADESKTCTVPRLGSFEITGDWFDVGTTTGTNTDTYQLPTNGSVHYFAGVFISKTASPTQDSDYEFFPRAGSAAGANLIGTDDVRGKVCWISTSGVLRLGHDGTNSIGYCPPSGLRIVIPNVILTNCTTAARGTNATPNATLGTRYDFTTTAGGAIACDKAMSAWYFGFTGANSLALSNSAVNDQIYLYNIGSEAQLTNSGVGLTAAYNLVAFVCSLLSFGVAASDCVFVRGATGGTSVTFADCPGITLTRLKILAVIGGNDAISCTRCSGVNITSPVLSGTAYLQYSSEVTIDDLVFFGRSGSAVSRATRVVDASTFCADVLIDGVTLAGGATEGAPTGAMFTVSGESCRNIKIYNLGSSGSPLDCDARVTYLMNENGLGVSDVKLARAWVSNFGGRPSLSELTSSGITVDNVYISGSTGDNYNPPPSKNSRYRGIRVATPYATAHPLAYGSHWFDFYTSDTAGLIRLMMNEASEQTASFVTLTNGAAFTGAGGLAMPSVGMSATFEMEYFALGHTGFSAATVPVMDGGTFTNYKYDFQVDTGSGWATWSSEYTTATALRDALAALSVTYTTGVKLKLRITTTTANTSAITAFTVYTTTTAEAQQTLYPLSSCAVQVANLATGSRVKAVKVSDGSVLFNGAESSGSVTFSTSYEGLIEIDVRKASSSPYYRPFVSRGTTVDGETLVITALQQLDE